MLVTQRQPMQPRRPSHLQNESHTRGISAAYAIPAHRSYGRENDVGTDGLSFAEHEQLRSRKTPYGRIDEQHEAASLDKNIHVPASKHVILSRSPQYSGVPPQFSVTENGSQSFHQKPNNFVTTHDHRRLAQHPSQFISTHASHPSWEFIGGADSVLHQTITVNDQKYYYHPGSQVPTVLPAAQYARYRPTAPAAQQDLGPFWPDGTFIPYQPAPVRDSRYLDSSLGSTPIQPTFRADDRTLRHAGRLPVDRIVGFDVNNQRQGQKKDASTYLPFCDRVFGLGSNKTAANKNAMRELAHHNVDFEHSNHPSLPTPGFHFGRPQAIIQPMESSDKIAFRDKTFSWAHRAYADLLDGIRLQNKLGRQSMNAYTASHSMAKPAIFPQPPQRAGSCFQDSVPGKAEKQSTMERISQSHRDGYCAERPQTAIRSTERRIAQNVFRPENRVSVFPGQNQIFTVSTAGHSQRHLPDPASQIHLPQLPPSPPSQHYVAMSALETMEALCDEATAPPWTDGMLLVGCLAYGLGDYTKALNWYQNVLAQEPKHVEAMSNLAATLLALDRREEALHYWSMAVKLRPSYFEAVDHLIGLLCTAHRAKDAVQVVEYVLRMLKLPDNGDFVTTDELLSDGESDTRSRSSSTMTAASNEPYMFDYEFERRVSMSSVGSNFQSPGFGSSGYAIAGSDNGRLLALIHAKGNLLYGLGDNSAAAAAFEHAVLIATGHRTTGIRGLIRHILHACVSQVDQYPPSILHSDSKEPILLTPERAQQTVQMMFPPNGKLPGLEFVPKGDKSKAAITTTSNTLLSLAKIYQDGMGNANPVLEQRANGTREILALYYLSLSLQKSASTANNVGILLAGVQQVTTVQVEPKHVNNQISNYAGIIPGSGVALALQYYNYGLNIDDRHAHLYTNLGSLFKDLNLLPSAIEMYTKAVECNGNFDIALANLANAVKDQGRIAEAIKYYRRAVQANPDFAEAVCGLATALNSVCDWYGRGGVFADGGLRDRIHVDENGKMHEARRGYGWMNRVVEIVDKQLKDGEKWGTGTLTPPVIDELCRQLLANKTHLSNSAQQRLLQHIRTSLQNWSGKRWEGARIVRLVERATRNINWQWYQDRYKTGQKYPAQRYSRPLLPLSLSSPSAPTVLPFHTFTTPLSAKQVRQISQRNALRISVAALRSPWLPTIVYPPPSPPSPCLNVGYVSSDFNNHPLAHLMQSIFGLHDVSRVRAFCYATTSSDQSIHRAQIEREAPVFYDASAWNVEKLVNQIVEDGIHVLVNLNGYTRGARNEVFACRPAPIQMSFMGFAGTLGAEWCDYVFADSISVPPTTLAPWRQNVDIEDRLQPETLVEDGEDWMYAENIIFARSTFFCVDHKQSAPDAKKGAPVSYDQVGRDVVWKAEQQRRWQLRKELFPTLSDSAVILGNFNQLYKIDPATLCLYLRILNRVSNAVLWLLRFPDIGEQYLMSFAREWAGEEVASRIIFTDVAPKGTHITRASVVDLFLDTPECNAHTTAADVIWSGTPIVTWARWDYKMCSRMASSIVASALPEGVEGDQGRRELLVSSAEEYEKRAISLASNLRYAGGGSGGRGHGRLMDLRRMLWEGRWTNRLFDTKRWVKDVEEAYWEAWTRWERGEGGDIWL